ncbi:type IV secretion protein Rhs, partial [Pseudomonas sp. PB120]|uniref:DUF6531 domain-containing protein n=1 Tax=Pseudomonas sp. PB120 TaxID=2494700 RepID=UPI00132C6666
MEHIARIEQELDRFPDTLSLYRKQLKHWFNQTADAVSHATDMPSLVGMDRQIKVGNITTSVSVGDNDFISSVVQCPQGGTLQIESKFESVYDIPLGNIQVDVIAKDGGETTPVTLDENGRGTFEGVAGKFYRVHVHSAVTEGQVDELFKSYDGLTKQLETWLRSEWDRFKPQWSQSAFVAAGNGMLAGSWAALIGVWDGLGLVFDILKNPAKYIDQLGSGAQQIADLAQQSPATMEKAMLLASDEAALCLLFRAASLWLSALPPSEIAGKTSEAASHVIVSVLIDILIASALAWTVVGLPIAKAYLTARGLKYGAVLAGLAMRFVEATFNLLNTLTKYVDHYKGVAIRGAAVAPKNGAMHLRWDAKRNTTLKQHEHRDDASTQAKNPNGDPADSADKTATHQCPVSMVTGEELLTLTDGALDGILPFDFTRLYRTSAAEIDSGLGFGWSHSL